MSEPLQFFPTNWINGMKISKDHFLDNDHAFTDALRDSLAVRITSFNYGLIQPLSAETSVQCWFNYDNQNEWYIRVTSCRAITPSGARIEITKHLAEKFFHSSFFVETTYRPGSYSEGNEFYILININPFERQSAGTQLLEETPPRYPFTQPTYSLSILPGESEQKIVPGNYQLIIGQIIVRNGIPVLSSEFIPPCINMNTDLRLMDFYEKTDKFLSRSEFYLISIIQKIHFKQQQNNLAIAVLQISTQCISFINVVMGHFKMLMLEAPPVYTFILISNMARTIKNTIDQIVNTGKEELLNYLSEWCGCTPNEIDTTIAACSNLRYNHNNISASIVITTSFINLFSKIFITLQQIDFIGKRQDANIFVKEETAEDSIYLEKHKIRSRFFTE